MRPALQETLLQLFEHIHDDPDSFPSVPIDEWDEGSTERHLLESFRCMIEQVHERIHQLKQAGQQVCEEEELYHNAFDATNDGLFIGDLEGTIVEVNPAACDMYGYTHEEMIGLTGFHLNHPDSHPLVEDLNATIPPLGTRLRLLALRKDGTTFYTEGQVAVFPYQGKQHRVAAVRDITAQVRAEEQLREREEQYRGIFEAATDAMFITTLEAGVIVEANPAACKMLGYGYEEMIGLSPAAIVHPDYLSQAAHDLQALQAGLPASGNMVLLKKDGTTFPTEGRSTIFVYKGLPHVLVVLRDISDRVEAERQLRESEEQYRGVFETTYDGLVISDLANGCYVEVNPAFCRMFGYSREELIGMHSSALAAPIDHHLVDEVLETLKAGQGYQTLVGQGLRKDGTMFYVESQGTTFMYRGKPHSLAVVRDITERVQAERQLREREEQYRSVFEATSDGLDVLDLDGFLVEVNPAFCQIYGYTREELIGMNVSALVPPASQSIATEGMETLKAGMDYKVTADAQGLRKDGTIFSAEAHGIPFTYGGQRHILGVVRDITERAEAEQQLRQKEEQYRGIFEATSDGLIIADLHGIIVEANPAACSIYGYAYEELLGLSPTALTHPDSLAQVAKDIRTIKSGSQVQTRPIGLHKDGSSFYAEVHGTPFTYKGQPHALAIVRDVTAQVQAEHQLREKEEQYRSIFESTYDAINIIDLDGNFVEVNPAFCRMFGYTRDELIGMHASATTAPETLSVLDDALTTFKAGRDYQAVVARGVRKDGTPFYAESHGTTLTYRGKPHALSVSRDVTERVEAERQLREQEEQYRSVFESTDDGLVIQTLDGFFMEANPAFCRMLGYTHDELLGLHYSEVTNPEYHSIVEENTRKVQAEGRAQAQGYARRKDGTSLPVEAHNTSFTYKGKPHILGVMRDITERVEAEQQLREKEEQYRSIFEATSDGLIIRNLEGAVVQVNPAACKMHGYSYEEYLALSRDTLIHPDYHPQLREIIQSVKAGRTFQGQAVDLRKDGSTFPVEFRSDPFTFLGQPHMLTVLHDITERVEAEKQLREREEQYRSIFEATNDAVFIMNPEDGRIVEANPAACHMYGYSYEEFIGLSPSAVIHPDQLPTFREEAFPLIKTGGERHIQGVNLRKDGSEFPIDLHQTVFTYQGEPHILAVMRDITEQVQAQQLLEQRVEERTRELSTLLEVSHNVASTLELKPLLNLILNQIKDVVEYTAATILIRDGAELAIVGYLGPAKREAVLQIHYSVRSTGVDDIVLRQGEPVIIDDVRASTPLAQDYREAVGDMLQIFSSYQRALLVVPLKLKDRVIGMLSLASSDVGCYTPHHASLIVAIANQAAIAIENAHLYEQAQTLASIEERQRLARELHDSVSQALYGISLGVHTARMQIDRNPKDLAESLDYVLELAEAALVEMRALIFELRPESLETQGLVTALTKQAAALQARQHIQVNTVLCPEPGLPLKVKQELYRIAQEALHNTVKHAHASRIDLRLHQTSEAVTLEVCDDGRGFDAAASFPGHLGLHSMQERVRGLGGELQIESNHGRGTCIRVRIPARVAM